MRIAQIARLRVAGQRDSVIAQAVGLSPQGLARILSLPEYKDAEDCVLRGVITDMDQALAGRADLLRKQFQVGVPLAMRTLLDAVQQRRDLRASLEAAREILDRDPDRVFVKQRGPLENQPPTLDAATLISLSSNADKVATSVATLKGVTPSAASPGTIPAGADALGAKKETVQ